MNTSIYLDHSATTPVHPQVIEAMLPYWTEHYGNPSSMHEQGRQASQGLAEARRTMAELIHARPSEIIFTGCGSESDNLAIRGVMWSARQKNAGNHLITCQIEHNAVLDTALELQSQHGFEVTVLGVDAYGQIDLAELQAAIRPDTVLISIMTANNEIGTLQPITQIGEIARERGVLFHSDAIQAAGYQQWDMTSQPIDLMSIAPHKFYGPKGVGMLYARQGVELVAHLTGGGQEDGRRAGTVNVPFAVGGVEAFRLMMENLEAHVAHYQGLRDRLIAGILDAFPATDCRLTGHPTQRLPHHASFAFAHANGNDLLMHLDVAGICASSGSACHVGNPEPSHVLTATGLKEEWSKGALRFTVGQQNTVDQIDYLLAELPKVVHKAQALHKMFTV